MNQRSVPYVLLPLKPLFRTISILETVVVLSNSPSSKICPKCLLIAGTPTPKSCAIAFWVHQSVSSLTTTCTLPSSSGRLYNRNCISLLIVCFMITSYTNISSKQAVLICFSFSNRWVWRVIWRSRDDSIFPISICSS